MVAVMATHLGQFLLHWGIMSLALWVASALFRGISFVDTRTLLVSALLLGMANAVVRPVVVFFTLPLTLLTLGGFLLVINALMVMLVSALVKGFRVSGFWTAFFVGLFISIFSFVLEAFVLGGGVTFTLPHAQTGTSI
jgi:putative membrane protein